MKMESSQSETRETRQAGGRTIPVRRVSAVSDASRQLRDTTRVSGTTSNESGNRLEPPDVGSCLFCGLITSLLPAFLVVGPADCLAVAEAVLPAQPANTLSIDWIVTEVKRNNPSLQAARSNWEALKSRIPQARAWEDPRVGVDVERSGTTRFDSFTDAEWMVGQEVPVSGKNRWRGRIALSEADAAQAELRRRELELLALARAAYYRLGNTHVQLELNDRNEALLRRWVEASRLK